MKKLFIFLLGLPLLLLIGIKNQAYAQNTPTVYTGTHSCSEGKQRALIPAAEITVSSQSASPTTITLTHTGEYLFEASGTYIYGAPRQGDAGYATNTTGIWPNLDTTLGIFPGASRRGIIALLSDMGTENMGIVEWGDYTDSHIYNFNYNVTDTTIDFVISDWWDSWYPSSYNNQGAISDNSGSLTVKAYECVAPLTTPVITGFESPTLSCNSLTNIHYTTIQWTDSSGGIGAIKYDYHIDYPLPGGIVGHWDTQTSISQYSGSLNEGLHTVKVRAKDLFGNVSDWSNSCSLTTDWTAPDVMINNPAEGPVSGVVDIRGTVTDLHPHHYWLAIYNSSTKIAGPGTVNESDSFTNESLMTWDTTLFPDGEYVIKLEARDSANNKDSGSVDWHRVTVDNDSDNDGVKNNQDLCPNTSTDISWSEPWGTNRWQYMNGDRGLGWYQNKPIKGVPTPTLREDLEYTCGCSGHQILDILSPFGNTMLGHWKFGPSSSIVEDFSIDCKDAEINGRYLLDNVNVLSNGTTTDSNITTVSGVEYDLKASGTYTFAIGWGIDGNGENYGIADAKFNNRDAGHNGGIAGWVDGSTWLPPYTNYLQVKTNSQAINWIEDFNLSHIYTASFIGDGDKIHFTILDDAYGDNSGSINVKIYGNL